MATATTKKPRINSKSVKEVIEPLLVPGTKNARARKLRSDWRRFFRDEFALSDDQQSHLDAIPARVASQIQHAFGEALDRGGYFRMRIPRGRRGGELEIVTAGVGIKPPPGTATAPRGTFRSFNVVIFHCHYDANCRNWKCKLGPHRPNEPT
jgi:hypothetical protein